MPCFFLARAFNQRHHLPMKASPEKACVFCGQPPEEKTKEHVVPLWVMKLTGDEKRTAFFGVHYANGPENLQVRQHAFSSYTLPACKTCNDTFAVLEDFAKRVVEKLLSEQPLTAADVEILLDWLDKVRVGLWIAGRTLGTNIFRASQPRFFVGHRVRWADRWARITLLPEGGQGLTYAGVGTPMFGSMPSAFAIRINRLIIQNASSPRMLTRWLGLPYPEMTRKRTPDGTIYFSKVCFGKNRLLPGLMDFPKPFAGLEVMQPAYPFDLKDCERPFRNPYAQAFFADLESLRAKPLFATQTEIRAIDEIGPQEYELMKQPLHPSIPHWFSSSALVLQNYVSEVGLVGGPPATERNHKRLLKLMNDLRHANRAFLKKMDAQVRDPSKSNDGSVELAQGRRVISI
ncbi:hypothetical protein [Porphyrobacter sp. ULC335]|uniref:hypothetical protein n=1 Tax=Porphyrobacter sp. ULC335 TaxID=2854260 RepID=UPI0022204D35|nr:hypothetical protein [Porphyrobacter sp. ULC335]UYV15423.1 hypothetical protein KVF90_15130 [Porphyrobacter sp. ULC335]